jgi:glycosyltransferase involved in cell wall biosynthesis
MQGAPIVSVVIANYNGATFIGDALGSVCEQSLEDIEVIVADDASTDDSVRIVSEFIDRDSRIRLLPSNTNGGPAAARNRAIAIAAGEWIAVLDSDDLMHPDRLLKLVQSASQDKADIAADDLLFFGDGFEGGPKALLRGRSSREALWINLEQYVRSNVFFGSRPALGYLKPIFRSSFLNASGVRYDERLRVGEDLDLVFRLLCVGARYRVYPHLTYFYRRHRESISHRLTPSAIRAIRTVDAELRLRGLATGRVAAAMGERAKSIETAIAFDDLLSAVKRRDLTGGIKTVIRHPRAAMLLRLPLIRRLRTRLSKSSPREVSRQAQVCVVANGAMSKLATRRRLLQLACVCVRCGVDVHFVSPNPTVFGGGARLLLPAEMALFKTVRVRGMRRVGRYLIATDMRSAWLTLQATLAALLARHGLMSSAPLQSLPPLSRNDRLFLAKYLPGVSDMVVACDSEIAAMLPYAVRPDARRIFVCDDIQANNVAPPQRADADMIVESRDYRTHLRCGHLSGANVLVAPVALKVDAAQAGRDDRVLFVGRAAAADVDGIRWFVRECWDHVRSARPGATLVVAGPVGELADIAAENLIVVPKDADVGEEYASAAVVIFPQQTGISASDNPLDAIAWGKVVVATPAAWTSDAEFLTGEIHVAGDASTFAAAVAQLLGEKSCRQKLSSKALAAVRIQNDYLQEAISGMIRASAACSNIGRKPERSAVQ